MAVDAFLYFTKGIGPEIIGETSDSVFKDNKAFQIKSYAFGMENPCTIGSGSGGGGSGKPTFAEGFTVSKECDNCTAPLFQTCAMGVHFPTVTLSLRRSGGLEAALPFLTFSFNLVFITGVTWSGSDDVPTEEIKFAYGSLKIEYWKQKKDGSRDTAAIEAMWSQVLNSDTVEVTSD